MRCCIILVSMLSVAFIASGQGDSSFNYMSLSKQQQFLDIVSHKYISLDKQIATKTTRTLAKLQKEERRVYKKLNKKDSAAARQFLTGSNNCYAELKHKLNESDSIEKELKEYFPEFDTIISGLSFLKTDISSDHPMASKLGSTEQAVKRLGARMQTANEIRKQLKERKKLLTEQLSSYGLVKDMKRLNKQMYYYQEQLKECKAMLQDLKRIEQKAIAALRNSRKFKAFMEKHSMLAKLFRLPEGYGSPESLAGLQTRSNLEALLATRFAGTGTNPQQLVQQQMQQGEAQLQKLKASVKRSGGVSSTDIEMPEKFKPNTQRSKSFIRRLEYGANFQTQRLNSYFPLTTDMAITLGYKLNDRSVVGIGASYKMGWGSGIQDIRFTTEGVGLRSYLDIKLKGSFWISGGYEQNYYQRLRGLQLPGDHDLWRQSALIGLTKKVKLSSKRSSKVQLMYDFFHQTDNIRTQPLVFRVEYSL